MLMVALGMVIAFSSLYLYNLTQPPPQRLTQRDIDAAVKRSLVSTTPGPAFSAQAFETIRPSVVRIEAAKSGDDGKTGVAVGTGVVIDDTGNILTSLHIVENSGEIRVTFADGTETAAAVSNRQPENDLAVLRPEMVPDNLAAATLAGSDGLRVGDEVVAVGNPFGIDDSLTAGVVSGLGRNIRSPETGKAITGLIQFDAAVNPGNSGGPLVNRNGEVVGIVTALLNPDAQEFFIGIGFAVPIETAGGMVNMPPL